MARPSLSDDQLGLLQGTLDMLILQTLRQGPAHGHQIAITIEQTSNDVLQVDHGSLYPALHRLLRRGWISGTWGVSTNNRRAKFYALTEAGRRQLVREATKWERMVEAVGRVMRPADADGGTR